MLRSMQARAGAAQPIVFVVPGIMGSHLAVGDQPRVARLRRARRGRLGQHRRRGRRRPSSPPRSSASTTAACATYLANSHEVIPFAYDWRKSVRGAATELAAEVEKALARSAQPVRILAHGMGGLVARAMIAEKPELWEAICARDGGRFVMLGTPNRGSHAMVETAARHGRHRPAARPPRRHPSRRGDHRDHGGLPGRAGAPAPGGRRSSPAATWREYGAHCRTAAVPADGLLAARQAVDGPARRRTTRSSTRSASSTSPAPRRAR